MIREITENDYEGLMKLYMQLHYNPYPEKDSEMTRLWNRILEDKDHHIIVAEEENCYKMMLLTGSKEESTLQFYEKAGYNRKDKTAFIQWLG